MGLEVATYISQLDASNPVGGVDAYSTADDHLRLLKSVLKAQFPNFGAAAVSATHAELNLLAGAVAAGLTAAEIQRLVGVTSAIQTQLNAKAASSHAHAPSDITGYTGNAADLNILAGAAAGGLSAAEIMFVNGVTSAIQTQLDGKAAASHAHAAGDVTSGVLADARIATTGSFTLTIAGFPSALSPTINWRKVGNIVSLYVGSGAVTGTSNTVDLSASGIPVGVRPTSSRSVWCVLVDNGVEGIGEALIGSGGAITFRRCDISANLSGFTSSGTKGLSSAWSITYAVD